jgi:predicted nucleic acid-binding protein
MPMVLANASPLIALGKLNRLELLADLYHAIRTTSVVYNEVVTQGVARGASDVLTVRLFWQHYGWSVMEVSSAVLNAYTPPVVLDPGEHELLALGQTLRAMSN